MQRKDIDQIEYDTLYGALADPRLTAGAAITTVSGDHPTLGRILLISAAGGYALMGADVHLVPSPAEAITGESDDATAAGGTLEGLVP